MTLCPTCKVREKAVSRNGYKYAYCQICEVEHSLERQGKANYKQEKVPKRRKIQRTREYLRNLFKAKKIKREECDACFTKENLQFHHPIQNDVMFVVLCKPCHELMHEDDVHYLHLLQPTFSNKYKGVR